MKYDKFLMISLPFFSLPNFSIMKSIGLSGFVTKIYFNKPSKSS